MADSGYDRLPKKAVETKPVPEGGDAPRPQTPRWLTRASADHFAELDGARQSAEPIRAIGRPGHVSNEIRLELGHGTIHGAVVATFEHDQIGLPLGDAEMKLAKETIALHVNEAAVHLEHALLNDEWGTGVWGGISAQIEASFMTGALHHGMPDVDLATIALKLAGDITPYLKEFARRRWKATVDGRIEIAIAGRIAQRLAALSVAQASEKAIAKKILELGETLPNEAKALEALKDERSLLKAGWTDASAAKTAEQLAVLDAKIAEKELAVKNGTKLLERLTPELEAASRASEAALKRLSGKLAIQLGKVMRNKVMSTIGKWLAHVIPILNLVAIVLDISDIIILLKTLHDHNYKTDGDGGGDEAGESGSGNGAPTDSKHQDKPGSGPADSGPADGVAAGDKKGGHEPAPDRDSKVAVREQLAPNTRAIVDALGAARGVTLDDTTAQALDVYVPTELTSDQLDEVVAILTDEGTKASTSGEIIEAVTNAIQTVRDRSRTISIDGVDRPDIANAVDGVVTSSAQVDTTAKSPAKKPPGLTKVADGPVIHPSDAKVAEAYALVHGFSPDVAAQWFEVRGDTLVMNAVGEQWRAAHEMRSLGEAHEVLRTVEYVVTSAGRMARWKLELKFVLVTGEPIKRQFFVNPIPSHGYHGAGAANSTASFVEYLLFDMGAR